MYTRFLAFLSLVDEKCLRASAALLEHFRTELRGQSDEICARYELGRILGCREAADGKDHEGAITRMILDPG